MKKVSYTPDNYRQYLTYNFVDKDPIIDLIRTLIIDVYGELTTSSLLKIQDASNVKVETLKSWFFGKTRRPFHASSVAVIRALGKDLKIVNQGDNQVIVISKTFSTEPVKHSVKVRRHG